MSGIEIIALVVAVLAIMASAVLAAVETAITHLSTAKAESLEEEGQRRAVELDDLIDQRPQTLATVLFFRLGTSLAFTSIVTVIAGHFYDLAGAAVAFIAAFLLTYVVAEAIPRLSALADTERVALRSVPLLHLLNKFRFVAAPFLSFAQSPGQDSEEPVSDVTEEHLLALAGEAEASDSIDSGERELIESIIAFGDTVAREVMVPRPDMVTVDGASLVSDALEIAIHHGYSRIPAIGENADDIVGVVHVKDLMAAHRDGKDDDSIDSLMREAMFVPETKRVSELMSEMQAGQQHQAIVVDEYGGTSGLVTLEDLIEELVGEIVDEFDVETPMIERLEDHAFRVNGRVAIADLEDAIEIELPEGDWDTVGGLLFNSLGHVPEVGETVTVEGHTLKVERVQGRRVARVRLEIAPKPSGGEDSEES